MGYDLRSKAGPFKAGIDTFPAMLRLAMHNGWQPAGTMIIREDEQDYTGFDVTSSGDYLSNSGQVVNAVDAASIADAIERALDDIPDAKVPHSAQGDHFGRWSGSEQKAYLREFINYCRAGAFSIY